MKIRGWRRIANAMWRAPEDPQIYGALDLEATALRRFVDGCREVGHKVTVTHLVGRALALALHEVPELNSRIVRGRMVPRPSADIFFITSVDGGRDLSGVKLEKVEHRSVLDIGRELALRSQIARDGDPELARSKRVMDLLPLPALRVALELTAWFTGDLDRAVPALGLASSPFGSAAVTSVASFGLPTGFVPLSWMYRVPILVVVGTIEEKPVADGGRVEVKPVLPITVTIDHRYVDGWHIGRAMKTFQTYLASPATFEPEAARLLHARAASRLS